MSDFKGTKGKWELYINPTSNGYVNVITSKFDFLIIGDVCAKKGDVSVEAKANALLISKAPEMLEMLRQLEIYLRDVADDEKFANKIEQLIKEATEL